MDKILKVPHVGMNYLNLTRNQKKSKIYLFEKRNTTLITHL